MTGLETFCIDISGIRIRFTAPTPVTLLEDISSFLCPDDGTADEEFQIIPITEPIHPDRPPVFRSIHFQIYPTEKGWLRIYPPAMKEDGCQVACLLRPGKDHTLYFPACKWDSYASPLRCGHLICAESLLLRHDAFLLHSSVVLHDGKAVLFSGPSGIGKSTQAALWAEHLGARILNGDRCVIRKMPDGFYGSGSPWAGSSRIYLPHRAKIAGIFLLEQGQDNTVEPMGCNALGHLLEQTTVNSWDPRFIAELADLYSQLLEQVPVYRLCCRPDAQAVHLALQTLF